jgi:hypothetical protein
MEKDIDEAIDYEQNIIKYKLKILETLRQKDKNLSSMITHLERKLSNKKNKLHNIQMEYDIVKIEYNIILVVD